MRAIKVTRKLCDLIEIAGDVVEAFRVVRERNFSMEEAPRDQLRYALHCAAHRRLANVDQIASHDLEGPSVIKA